MKELRQIPGIWWIPSTPSDRWVGTLTLEPGEMPRLDITVPSGFDDLMKRDAEPVIHGCDQQGKPVTLLFSGPPRGEYSPALSRIHYSAGYAILGIELANKDAFQVHSLYVTMQHLHEWLGLTGFLPKEPLPFRETKIHYRSPDQREFVVNADLMIKVGMSYSYQDKRKEERILEESILSFHHAQGMSLQQCQTMLSALRHLLHFGILAPVHPVSITANKQGFGKTIRDIFYPDQIELWSSVNRSLVESEFVPERWVFHFTDVESRFGQFFDSWLNLTRTYAEALECYFTTIYHPLPSVVQHLCLTQALEAFHGIKNQSHNVRDFLLKIRALNDQFKNHLPQVSGGSNDFPETVRDNRNYYTHHNPKWLQDGRVVSGAELFRLNEKLKLLFQMCILTEMGIPEDRFVRLNRQLASIVIDFA